MSVVAAVLEAAAALESRARISRAVVGGIYVAVQLEGGAAGVAYRFPEGEGCHRGTGASAQAGQARDAGQAGVWAGAAAGELIPRLGAGDLVESALALATVNALCGARAEGTGSPGDVLEHVEIRDGDRLCMVGCFLPVLERLRARKVEVLSVDERPKPGALPAEQVEAILPTCQVALITATSLVNGTLDHLLGLSAGCRSVALLGPSTPMLPRAFAFTGVGLLSGIRVLESERVLEIVAAGGGFRDFRTHVIKVNLRV